MARIKTETPVKSIHGKLDKSDDVTFYHKKGNRQFAWKNSGVADDYQPSAAQTAHRAKFAAVSALASEAIASPELKEQWQIVADNSDGKYTSAFGAAFAYEWDNYEPEVQE